MNKVLIFIAILVIVILVGLFIIIIYAESTISTANTPVTPPAANTPANTPAATITPPAIIVPAPAGYIYSTDSKNYLGMGESIVNGSYSAIYQNDGNFVAYGYKTWAANTEGVLGGKLTMQEDGNLVLYDSGGSAKWASNTNGKGTAPYQLIIQSDGNLVVYDKNKNPLWSAGTNKG